MRIIKYLAIILCFSAITSCSFFGSSISRMVHKSDIISKNFKAEEEFNFDKTLIVIQVVLKGKEYEFIFDTGAAISVLSQDAANALNIEEQGASYINDSQGNKQKLGLGNLDTVNIAGVLFKDIAVSIIDWPENSAIECIGKDGLIGNNLIRHCNWLIDYENKKLILSDSHLGDDDFIEVPMKYGKSRPRLDIQINSKNLKNVLLDLGSGGGLDISKSLANELNLTSDKYQNVFTLDGSSQGLFGNKVDSVLTLKIDSLGFGHGKYPLYNSSLDIESKNGAKIGNRILKKSLVLLDYKNNRIGFKPYKPITRFKDQRSFSFTPSLGDNGLYISSLNINGRADQLGLKYGDKIKSLNGIKADEFADYCTYLEFVFSDIRASDSLIVVMDKKPGESLVFHKKALWEN